MEMGNYEKALDDFMKAVELDPSGLTYFNKGLANYHLKNYEEALDDINKSLEYDPDNEKHLQIKAKVEAEMQ